MINFYNFLESLQSVGGFGLTNGWNVLDSNSDKTGTEKEIKNNINYFLKAGKKIVVPELYKVLERSAKFPIHIYFGLPDYIEKEISSYALSAHSLEDEVERGKIIDTLEDYFFGDMGIPETDIVYVKAQSGGDIWKPWMVLHGMGHAIDAFTNSNYSNSIIRNVRKYYDDILQSIGRDNGFKYIIFNRMIGDSKELRKLLLSSIFNFRSAGVPRKEYDKIQSEFDYVRSHIEFCYELIPWYFYNSCQIPLPIDSVYDAITEKLVNKNPNVHYSREKVFNKLKRETTKMLSKIDEVIETTLNSCRGQVLMD